MFPPFDVAGSAKQQQTNTGIDIGQYITRNTHYILFHGTGTGRMPEIVEEIAGFLRTEKRPGNCWPRRYRLSKLKMRLSLHCRAAVCRLRPKSPDR
jgi:hypothetical protein